MSLMIQRLSTTQADFWQKLENLLAWNSVADEQVMQTVREILNRVRTEGDAAVLEYTRRFDRRQVQNVDELIIPEQ